MNPPDSDSPISSRQVTVVLCTEYDAHNRLVAITYLPEGIKTIPEHQKHPLAVRAEYKPVETEEITFEL